MEPQEDTNGSTYQSSIQGKVPRPMNCFFVYRREKQQELQMTMPGENNQNISVIIGDMWKNESEDVKELYKQKAEQEKVIHSSLYPGYKYVPKRSGKKNRIRRNTFNLTLPSAFQASSSTHTPTVRSPKFIGRRASNHETGSLLLPPLRSLGLLGTHYPVKDIKFSPSATNCFNNFHPIEPTIKVQPSFSNFTLTPF